MIRKRKLEDSCRDGNIKHIKEIIRRKTKNKDTCTDNIMINACKYGQIDIIEYVIKHCEKCKINARSYVGQ